MSEKISLNGAIVRYDGEYWLLVEATDLETAWGAIIEARVTGSVGSGLSVVKPSGEISHNATVKRLTALSYTEQGVYGAPMDSVDWKHPVLTL